MADAGTPFAPICPKSIDILREMRKKKRAGRTVDTTWGLGGPPTLDGETFMIHADDGSEMAAAIPSSIRSEDDPRDLGGKQNLGTVSRQLLSQSALFRGLAADECKRLIDRARMRTFTPRESIFLMGSEPDCMMAILTGRVQISVPSPDGDEMVLAVIGPGSIIGEISLLQGGERTADARALMECSVAILY